MNADLYLVIGIVLFVLVIPSMLSAFTEGRAPRVAMGVVLVSGVLIVLAVTGRPGGYTWDEVPMAFARVFDGLAR